MWDLTDDSEISLTSMNARTQPKDVRKCIMSLCGVTIFIKFTVHFTIIYTSCPLLCLYMGKSDDQDHCYGKTLINYKGGKFLKKLWCCISGRV